MYSKIVIRTHIRSSDHIRSLQVYEERLKKVKQEIGQTCMLKKIFANNRILSDSLLNWETEISNLINYLICGSIRFVERDRI